MRFYVYAILSANELPLYIGKGSGGRHKVSSKRYDGVSRILEYFSNETKAYAAERRWIKELKPEFNRHPGGNGRKVHRKRQFRKTKEWCEMDRIGTKVYAARILLKKLDESNCEKYGLSKIGISRLRVVAYG